MLNLSVRSMLGVGAVPRDRASAVNWLKRRGIVVRRQPCNGGTRDEVALSDLPAEVRLALQLRTAEAAELPAGQMDDAAHLALEAKPPGVREEAYRRATIMGVVMRHRAAGRTWAQVIAHLWENPPVPDTPEDPFKAPSEATLKDWCSRVEGVDPVNWGPALAPGYDTKGRPKVPCDPAAWEYFLNEVAGAGGNGTGPNLRRAHGKAVKAAAKEGWTFPRHYRTALRHWQAMDVERQRTIRDGEAAAVKSLTTFQPRSVADMVAMEQVEVDFREFGVWCRWPDGAVSCPWIGVAVDRASGRIVGWTVAGSESEEAVFDLLSDMVARNGIPHRIVQDNGSAFNGFRIMGGHRPLVRRKDKGPRNANWDVPGIYRFLEIAPVNHGPRQAWAKLPESVFSALRHLDNDPVFHRAQRTGPNDRENPDPVPVDLVEFCAALDAEVAAFNGNTASSAKALRKGECRDDAFLRLSDGRFGREPTPLQKRWMRLKWGRCKVSNAGQVRTAGGMWGDGTSQTTMLRYAGKFVVVGIDPADPAAPAMVYEWDVEEGRDKRMIVAELPAVIEARHNDEASKQRAKAEKRRAKAVVQKHLPKDLDEHVRKRRADLMAGAGQVAAGTVSKVTQLPKASPFSPKPSVQDEDAAFRKARTEEFFRLKREAEERKRTG